MFHIWPGWVCGHCWVVARGEVESRTGASFGSVAELMADLNEAD